jgi:hypothetical protein
MEPGSGGAVEAFVTGSVSDFLLARGWLPNGLVIARNGIKLISEADGSKAIAVNVINKHCPFKGSPHARHTSVLYVWITEKGVSFRCRDDAPACKIGKIEIPSFIPPAVKTLVRKQRKRPTPATETEAAKRARLAPPENNGGPIVEEPDDVPGPTQQQTVLGTDVAPRDRDTRRAQVSDWASDLLFGSSEETVTLADDATVATDGSEILMLEEPRYLRNCRGRPRHRIGVVFDHQGGGMCLSCILDHGGGRMTRVANCGSRPTHPEPMHTILGIAFNTYIQINHYNAATRVAEDELALQWLEGNKVTLWDDDPALDLAFKRALSTKDAFVADLFAHVYGDKVAYARDLNGKGRFWIWDGLWKPADDGTVRAMFRAPEFERIVDEGKKRLADRLPDSMKSRAADILQRLMDFWVVSKKLSGVMAAVEVRLNKRPEHFLSRMDKDDTIVCFENGYLWFTKTNEIRPSTPKDLVSPDFSVGYDYDRAKFTDAVKRKAIWDTFVNVFNANDDLLKYLFRQLCAALGGENYQRLIFYHGVGVSRTIASAKPWLTHHDRRTTARPSGSRCSKTQAATCTT